LPLKFIEHFDETAHMRALEVSRQIYVHVDGSAHRLCAARAVQDD